MSAPPPNTEFYHAHIYYDLSTRSAAAELRKAITQELGNRVRVHNLIDQAIGPHPLPMFEIDIPAGELSHIKTWLAAHHGAHSILIHPLTGDDMADHRDYPQWIGPELALNLEFLRNLRH